MELRPARFDEIPEVLRLVQRSVAFGCRAHYGPDQQAAVFATYARALFVEALGPFESIVAELGGRIVAFAQVDTRRAHLRALFVDDTCQRHGVGRALLAEVEARAARHGCSRLHGAMSLNAAPFYAGAGFVARGAETLKATSLDGGATVNVPIIRMEKRLEGRPSQPALSAASGLWSARNSL
jgi:GNAT superfamily N-acetyltransferase